MRTEYDIIVIGGGHAGCEAAAAAANLGSRTLLISMDMSKFASMSCNPAVGGVAKGQIVREIDALGGQMGRITDLTTIQFRMLNRSKGAAMWSPRAQCDKAEFSAEWRRTLENTWQLYLWQDSATELLFEQSSKYYTETPMTVADFIDATLADSELDFRNSSYYKVYELYFTMYQEGLTQQQIQQRLLNSMDEEVAAVAKDILIEKYEITVKNYVQSMTAAATRLVMFVPKSLLVYQAKRVEMEVKEKMEEVQQTSDPERQMALLAEITALNKVRTAINNELGRV